jgi:hypothetical protein
MLLCFRGEQPTDVAGGAVRPGLSGQIGSPAPSFQELGLVSAVYRRVLSRAGLVQQADHLVEPGGQDDDES